MQVTITRVKTYRYGRWQVWPGDDNAAELQAGADSANSGSTNVRCRYRNLPQKARNPRRTMSIEPVHPDGVVHRETNNGRNKSKR
jgi:hypothetical protein